MSFSSFISSLSVSSSACSSSSILSTWFLRCTNFSAMKLELSSIVAIGQNSWRANMMPPTAFLQNASGDTLEYTFGIISPKSSRRKVSNTVMHRNCNQYNVPKSTS